MNKTFGSLLRELRRAKGISQRNLADQIGVDFSYISKVENDRIPPPAADTIEKISQVLDIPSEILLTPTGKLPSEIKDMLSKNTEAIKFMKAAKQMNLSGKEWDLLTENLKKLR